MVHGLLQDRHNEFFIQRSSSQGTQPQSPDAPTPSPYHPLQHSQVPEEANAAEWHQGFQVSMQALPPGITVSIAESILFVGKAVRVLQKPTGPLKSHDLLPQSDAISFAQALRHLQQQDVFDQIGFERTVDLIRTKVSFRGETEGQGANPSCLMYVTSKQNMRYADCHTSKNQACRHVMAAILVCKSPLGSVSVSAIVAAR